MRAPLPQSLSEHARRFWPSGDAVAPPAPGRDRDDAITIVTAFFDIGRDGWGTAGSAIGRNYRRCADIYMERFGNLAPIRNDLVVFVEPALAQDVLDLRRAAGLEDRTTIYTIDGLFDLDPVRPILEAVSARMTGTLRRFVWQPDVPEYNDPRYVLVNALKSSFVLTAIDMGAVNQAQVAWIDFGYCRTPDTIDPEVEWRYDAGGKINLFCGARLDDRPIFDIVRNGCVYFQGCHIVGPVQAWAAFNARLAGALERLLTCDLVDDDQTLLLMSWRQAPDEHIVHEVDLGGPLGWFFIFRAFRSGAPRPVGSIGPVRIKKDPAWLREMKASLKRRRGKTGAAQA